MFHLLCILNKPSLFCSLAVLDPRVGHTMAYFLNLSLSSAILIDFHGESCSRLDVVHPGRAWPSLLRAPGIVPCIICLLVC